MNNGEGKKFHRKVNYEICEREINLYNEICTVCCKEIVGWQFAKVYNIKR